MASMLWILLIFIIVFIDRCNLFQAHIILGKAAIGPLGVLVLGSADEFIIYDSCEDILLRKYLSAIHLEALSFPMVRLALVDQVLHLL
jgi:hypothetical protein